MKRSNRGDEGTATLATTPGGQAPQHVGGLSSVKVELGPRTYEIRIGPNLLDSAGPSCAPYLARPRTAVVTDQNVADLHLDKLTRSFSDAGVDIVPVIVAPGEGSKNFAMLETVCDRLLAAGVERRDTIIAFGGGVIGDLAGFAAAVLLRGIDFIQIPTSLLAQVDSSVGGKTGINAARGKNLIGAFHQPRLVLADTGLLDSLPPREFRAGYAEVVKYGLLGDSAFFSWLEANRAGLFAFNGAERRRAIEVSCRAKAAIVAEDEREQGTRALLNLGHTFGHALEAATGYSDRLNHGEGVAIGMALAFRFSERLGLCPPGRADRVAAHLAQAGLPTRPRDIPGPQLEAGSLVEIMRQDKKALGGRLVFVLVRDIGAAFLARDIAESDVLDFLTAELANE